jgi:type II secretory pathway pseudopilin PulG
MPGFYGPGDRGGGTEAQARGLRAAAQRAVAASPVPGLLRRPLSILVAIVVLFVTGVSLVRRADQIPDDDAHRVRLAADNLAVLMIALDQLARDCSRYPSSTEGLVSLIHNPGLPGWRGPYIYELKPDPWMRPFAYRTGPTGPAPFSLGPDGVTNTDDDVQVPAHWDTALESGKTPVVPVNLPVSHSQSNFQDIVYQP